MVQGLVHDDNDHAVDVANHGNGLRCVCLWMNEFAVEVEASVSPADVLLVGEQVITLRGRGFPAGNPSDMRTMISAGGEFS